jgi:hypothetical protein
MLPHRSLSHVTDMPKQIINRNILFTSMPCCLLLIAVCLFAIKADAADFYMTPSGAGTATGLNFDNALPKSELSDTLNVSMAAGDTLYLGSGEYGSTAIGLSTNGTSTQRKRIIGVDTGNGVPHFDGNGEWDRSDPDSGQWSIINLSGSYWSIENLELSGVVYAIRGAVPVTGVDFKNLVIHHVRHGVYVEFLTDALFENIVMTEYTKHGFRVNQGCDQVMVRNCLADLSGGDDSWWDYSESHPFGFVVEEKGTPNSNITFVDCIARNHRRNSQGISYWNGDGFTAEGNAVNTRYIRCIAENNEDGGFDIKPAATFEDCVSIQNYRGFRLWDSEKTMTNCVAAYPLRRSNDVPDGAPAGAGIWLKDGTATVDHYTYYSDVGIGVHEDDNGSAHVMNSVLSFTATSGTFTSGNVVLDDSTVTYRPSSGIDPRFIAPSETWDGIGDDFNNLEYGPSKGYYRLSTQYIAVEVADNVPIGTIVTTIPIADSDLESAHSFSITAGNDALIFAINSNGSITTLSSLSDKSNASYILTVTDSTRITGDRTTFVTMTISELDDSHAIGLAEWKDVLSQVSPPPVLIHDAPLPGNTSVTIDMSEMLAGDVSFEFIVAAEDFAQATATLLSDETWALNFETGNDENRLGMTHDTDGDFTASAVPGQSVASAYGQTIHLVYVVDSEAALTRIYIDGVQVGRINQLPIIDSTTAMLGSHDLRNDSLTSIYAFAAYNSTLSLQEIITHYRAWFGADSPVDADNDMLDDSWELTRYGNIEIISGADRPSGNGYTAFEEMIFGISDNNSMPPQQSQIIVIEDVKYFEFRYRRPQNFTIFDVNYQLQTTGDLTTTSWVNDDTPSSGIQIDGSNEWILYRWPLLIENEGQQYYRCKVMTKDS